MVASFSACPLSAVYYPHVTERKFVHIERGWAWVACIPLHEGKQLNRFVSGGANRTVVSPIVIASLVLCVQKDQEWFPNQDHVLFLTSVFVSTIFIQPRFPNLFGNWSRADDHPLSWRWLMIYLYVASDRHLV
jgi:hypothetical protein